MRRFTVTVDTTPTTADFGGLEVHVAARLAIRDQAGKTVSSAEVDEAFRSLSATGYCVKMRLDAPMGTPLPPFAAVDAIEGDTVTLVDLDGGRAFVLTSAEFHRLYEVD